MSQALVFGASGVIGREIVLTLSRVCQRVVAVSRSGASHSDWPSNVLAVSFDPVSDRSDWSTIGAGPFDRVVFAQGANRGDSLYDFNRKAFEALLTANVTYVASSLAELLAHKLLDRPARIGVISSIWQTMARQEKLSYMVSKAALQGLIMSASVDLARDGHLINAVLPGVLDTQMTRDMLSSEEIAGIEGATLFRRLPAVRDVVEAVDFLCSKRNGSITGQFVAVDLGFRHIRLV